MNERLDAALDALVQCYETLSPDSLPQLLALYAPQACFRDPFNDVAGVAAIEAVFRHMFATVADPRFRVNLRIRQGEDVVLRWRFTCRLRGRALDVEGVSLLVLAGDGRVTLHQDYWDPVDGLYSELPLVGGLFGALKRAVSAHKAA